MMKLDANIPPTSLDQVPAIANLAEEIGFSALWSAETQHDPFLPLALVSENTSKINFGTAIAVAFGRSPATIAYTCWDLADASGGRMILGLGTQVKAHIERRFAMPWPESPVGKLRELIAAVRAFWHSWQTGEKLNYRGEYYKLTLMSPFFNPGPIKHPDIPVYIAGVNTGLCRLAGEVADGFHVHPFHTADYLREVIRPAIAEGAKRTKRSLDDVSIAAPVFVVTDPDEDSFIRAQIGFYASTPSYRVVMEHHGWGDVADQLNDLSRKGGWMEMPALISDEMLETFALVTPEDGIADALKERYAGLADRVTLYLPLIPGDRDDFWRKLAKEMRKG
jgi:probable F420-dependent oxidoreductase